MNEIWFTSDTHFSHDKEFLYEPRGFTNVKDMNEALVENWNKIVKLNDTVYHLGDLALGDKEDAVKYIKQLHGKIYWIYGNHCTNSKIDYFMDEVPNLYSIGYASMLKYNKKYSFYMSHYPTLTANYDDKKFSQHVIAVHGHTHQRGNWIDLKNPFTYHVGVDSHNNAPVHIDEVVSDIRQRWSELGQLPTPSKPEDLYPYGGMI